MAIKILSAPSSRMGSKVGRSHFTAYKITLEVPQGWID
jgi:hypothetical protein